MRERRSAQLIALRTVAKALGSYLGKVVFVGGSIADFLVTDPGSPDARPTDDVDMVIETQRYSDYANIQEGLRKLGFTHEMDGPVCRFTFQNIPVDIMPTEESGLGFTNRWYAYANKNAIPVPLDHETEILILDAPTFLCTKIEAFINRGNNDFQISSDIEDIVSIINGRPELFEDLYNSDQQIKAFLYQVFSQFLASRKFLDALPGFVSVGKDDRQQYVTSRLDMLLAFALNPDFEMPCSAVMLPRFAKLADSCVSNPGAPGKSLPFVKEQHDQLALIICELFARFSDIYISLLNFYPRSCPIQRKAAMARDKFSSLKSEWDSEYCKLPIKTPPYPYYEGSKANPPKFAEFLDEEVLIIAEVLTILRRFSLRYYDEESPVIESLEAAEKAFRDLYKSLHIGYKPKKRIESALASQFSFRVKAAIEQISSSADLITAQHKTGDFLNHECDFCRPLGEKSGEDLLPAYSDTKAFRGGGYQLYVWCRFCWCFHLHGGGNDPLNGTGDGSRVTHCWKRDELGYYEKGYSLKCVGYLTPEIKQAHQARESVRAQYVRAIKRDFEKKDRESRAKAFIKVDQIICGICYEGLSDKCLWLPSELKNQRYAYFAKCSMCEGLTNVNSDEFRTIARPDLFP